MKKWIVYCVLLGVILQAAACDRGKPRRYESENLALFDTVTKLIGYTDTKEQFDDASQKIYDDLRQYHELYDIYHEYEGINNLKTVNDMAGISPVKVDRRIIDLLLFAKEQYEKTGGKMNIAFGAVLKIWHDYRTQGVEDESRARLPSGEELKVAANHTDIDRVILDEEASTVYLSDPLMSLDVGAVGKGYATEQVSQKASQNGFVSGLLSVGGNVRAIGVKNDQSPWNVGIQNPDKESKDDVLCLVNLAEQTLVTSGNYERYYIVNNKRYHHIIDPETLMPSEYFSSVSIVGSDSGVADAMSTALFNMPLEQGKKLIESIPDTYAMWVLPDGEIQYSNGFEKNIRKK